MARRRVCALVALLGALGAPGALGASGALGAPGTSGALRAVTIALAEECVPDDSAMITARSEATRIWSRGDVGLRWVAASRLPFESPKSEWLLVQCNPGRSPDGVLSPARNRAVAAIRFLDAEPMNVITLSVQDASRLLDQDAREGRLLNNQFPALREVRLGRMLGRAVAHEIGHFLSRSAAHTDRGLMKPTHSVEAFTGVSLQPFSIGSEFRRVLLARRASGEPADAARQDSEP